MPPCSPRSSGARASWNYLKPHCRSDGGPVLVSYHMNPRMRLTELQDYLVTLNATDRIADSSVIARMQYEHPVYTPESVAAQRLLPELNTGPTAFAGAYHGWGFHEDGCTSGVRAAAALGVDWCPRPRCTTLWSPTRAATRCTGRSATAPTSGWSTSTSQR